MRLALRSSPKGVPDGHWHAEMRLKRTFCRPNGPDRVLRAASTEAKDAAWPGSPSVATVAPNPGWPPWRQAWQEALYGADGFYRRNRPAAHFRTSVHASPLFAQALLQLVRQVGLSGVVDVGAGDGELLGQLHREEPALRLHGVEITERPADLPPAIGWSADLPKSLEGLVVANEWLDNVPCEVVEHDCDGVTRVVHVDPQSGRESLGASVEAEDQDWLARWWSLAEPGQRAEVGRTRDAAWAEVVGRLRRGVALAIDYGHLQSSRPRYGSLAAYLNGRPADLRADASRDLTAHVAWDSLVAVAPGGRLLRQHEALSELGVSRSRPSPRLASAEPATYLAAYARAGEAAELTEPAGLGGFGWVVHSRGIDAAALPSFLRPGQPS